jgi:hypothetical protein
MKIAIFASLSGELAKHGLSEGTKAVTKSTAADGADGNLVDFEGGGAENMSAHAGLQFSVARAGYILSALVGRVQFSAGVYVY